VNDGAVERILREQNRWWRTPTWAEDDPDLRGASEARFTYQPRPLADVHPPSLYILWGPRRVGKSVELKRLVEDLLARGVPARSIFYCSCENFSQQDLRRLFVVGRRIAVGAPGPFYWLLDEITSVPSGWPDLVKQLRDQTQLRTDCVVLTGSSARDLQSATKALADRRGDEAASDRLLLPMPFAAAARAMGMTDDVPTTASFRPRDMLGAPAREAIEELSYHREGLEGAWENYLAHGGFPRAVDSFLRTGDASLGFVNGLWQIIKGDAVRRGAQLADPELIALMHRLTVSLGSPLNASSIARDVGFSTHHRVQERVEDLCQAFLAWRCFKIRGELPSPAGQWKVYFTDPLLAQLVSRRDGRYGQPDRSVVSEQQLGLILMRAMEREMPGSFVESGQVMYERTRGGAEIDFVGANLGVAFESKYVDDGWKREARTLEARYGRGVIVTRSVLDLEGPIWAVPAGIVAWLIDQ
jgi:predicted AAA+ superfamily ATPase